MIDLISKAADLAWSAILPVVGMLTMLAAGGVFWFAWSSHRKDQRRARARRDERAWTHTPDAVRGPAGLPLWLDFVRDHDLHKIQPKEDE
ncbi:hypothetical protein AB0L65_20815 [Nonomuraea sp. NPDC052116]|uniref:hypothetical protein n=1 Tax=Nonomuraea sp. NPDC052116 TaxID=3155665 RepID=UPI00344856A6